MADEHPENDESPWTQRGFLVAAALVLGIVLVALVLVVSGGDSDTDPPRAATPATTGTPSPEPSSASDSACGLPAGDQTTPTATPADTNWELVGSMAAPQAPMKFGPARTTSGLGTCFARSPMGALYAAINFWASSTEALPADVIRVLAVRGPTRDQAIRESRNNRRKLDAGGPLQVVGYNFTSYDPQSASIDIAFRVDSERFARFPTVMRWQDGDWRYVIPPGGNPGIGALPDLTGFVAWSGA